MPTDLVNGARYLIRGLRLITAPGLRRYALIPLLVTSVVLVAVVTAAVTGFEHLLDAFLPQGDEGWVALLRALLWPLFVLAVLLLALFSFTIIANLAGAPFNGLLAERVEARLTGAQPDGAGIAGALRTLPAALGNELRKLGYYVLWALPLSLLSLIPAINVLAPLFWLVFLAWMLALEYAAYPMENHGLSFKETRLRLRRRRWMALGFGAAALGLMGVPLLNLLAMPAAVAGATAMWVERLAKGSP